MLYESHMWLVVPQTYSLYNWTLVWGMNEQTKQLNSVIQEVQVSRDIQSLLVDYTLFDRKHKMF
jgi:hypothetical protein